MKNYIIIVNDEKGSFRKIFADDELHTAVGIYAKYIIDNQKNIFEITLFCRGIPIMMTVADRQIYNGRILQPVLQFGTINKHLREPL